MKALGLLSKLRIKTSPEPTTVSGQPSRLTETPTSLHRYQQFGCHLAFGCDEHHLQMAAVHHLGHRLQLVRAEVRDLPDDFESEDARADFISDSVRQFSQHYGSRRAQTSLVIFGQETVFRSFLVPDLKRRDLKSALVFEAKKQLPFPTESCFLHYRVSSRVHDQSGTRLRVAMHAATAAYVQSQLAPFTRAGLPVAHIHHAPDAIGQLLPHLKDFARQKAYTLVEVFRHGCQISYFRGVNLEFTFAGSTGSASLGDFPDPTTLQRFAEALLHDVRASQDYYIGQHVRSLSGCIYFFGDLRFTNDVIEHMNGLSALEFRLFPIAGLSFVSTEAAADPHGLACLSAIASAANQANLPDLISPEMKQAALERRRLRYVQSACTVLALTLALIWLASSRTNQVAREEVAQLERRLAALEKSEAYRVYQVMKQEIAADEAYLQSTRSTPSNYGYVLKEISRLTPPSLRLTDLRFSAEDSTSNTTMSGLVTTSDVPPEIVMAEFVQALRASPLFRDVIVERHQKQQVPEGFELQFSLRAQGVIS